MWGRRDKIHFSIGQNIINPEPCIKVTIFFSPLCWRCTVPQIILTTTSMNNFTLYSTIWMNLTQLNVKRQTQKGADSDYYLVIKCRTLCDHSILFHLSVSLFLCKCHSVLVIKTSKELSGTISPPALFSSKIVLEKARLLSIFVYIFISDYQLPHGNLLGFCLKLLLAGFDPNK